MPKQAKDYRQFHNAADVYEAKIARQFKRVAEALQDEVFIEQLASVFAQFDKSRAADDILKLLPLDDMPDLLEPLGNTIIEAFNRGGRLGAKQVRDILNA